MVKISKQTIDRILAKPEAELDLHHHTQNEAKEELEAFLHKAEEQNWKTVRVIVGKGWNSPEGKSVIGRLIRELLRDYGYRFRNAKPNEGGEGALIVTLY